MATATKRRKAPGTEPEANAPVRQSTVGILRLKLGRCCTSSTRRLREDLAAVALDCNRLRNAMFRAWQRYREDDPDAPEGSPFPARIRHPDKDKEVAFTGWLVAKCWRKVAPRVSSQLAGACAAEVASRLKARMPYNHAGTARFRWRAILAEEVNLDTCRQWSIPWLNNQSTLCYCGDRPKAANVTLETDAVLRTHGASGCAVSLLLWSGESGRRVKSPVTQVHVGPMSRGDRKVLARLCRGGLKVKDSEVVFREPRHNSREAREGRPGEWWLHLVYERPVHDHALDASRTAVLTCAGPGAENPFLISEPDGYSRSIGRGLLMRGMFSHYDRRRVEIRARWKVSGPGRRGHGRQRIERDPRDITRRVQNVVRDFTARDVAAVVAFCVRNDCGTLAWREPPLPQRPGLWHAGNGVQWDWTSFQSRLVNQCALNGIVITDALPSPAPRAGSR